MRYAGPMGPTGLIRVEILGTWSKTSVDQCNLITRDRNAENDNSKKQAN